MSIYQRPKRPIDPNDVTGPVTRGGRSAPQSGQNWASVRKAKPVDYMLSKSFDWYERLPKAVRPLALITKYPRIANLLAHEWSTPAACRAYFDDLLVDRRGNRQGFPADVDRDLRRLRDHYLNLHLTLDE